MGVSQVDLQRLRRCVELAHTALDNGHAPFGAILVDPEGRTLHEDHNRTTDDDQTLHAEMGIIRWAVANLAPVHRIRTTVYTSCEQCPMCAAAHAWAGLGRTENPRPAVPLHKHLDIVGALGHDGKSLDV